MTGFKAIKSNGSRCARHQGAICAVWGGKKRVECQHRNKNEIGKVRSHEKVTYHVTQRSAVKPLRPRGKLRETACYLLPRQLSSHLCKIDRCHHRCHNHSRNCCCCYRCFRLNLREKHVFQHPRPFSTVSAHALEQPLDAT